MTDTHVTPQAGHARSPADAAALARFDQKMALPLVVSAVPVSAVADVDIATEAARTATSPAIHRRREFDLEVIVDSFEGGGTRADAHGLLEPRRVDET